jgi:predicted PhzF superfamily epimerase YddE/YHI9
LASSALSAKARGSPSPHRPSAAPAPPNPRSSRRSRALGLDIGAIRAAEWIDNGPGWVGALLDSRAAVLALRPDFAALGDLKLGVIGPWDAATDGDAAQFEVRAFIAGDGGNEDPVTGSLNASLAQWLIGAGIAPETYTASQGTALGRAGRIYVRRIGADVWVGGDTVTCVAGTLTL